MAEEIRKIQREKPNGFFDAAAGQKRHCSDRKLEDLTVSLEERTIQKVEEVTGQAEAKMTQVVKDFETDAKQAKQSMNNYAAAIRKEMKTAHRDISDQYRKAFAVGAGWKVLMCAGSISLIAMLVLHYVLQVV